MADGFNAAAREKEILALRSENARLRELAYAPDGKEMRRALFEEAQWREKLREALAEMLADLDDPELPEISAATITRARQALLSSGKQTQ